MTEPWAKLLWERIRREKAKLLAAQIDIAMGRTAAGVGREGNACQGRSMLLVIRAKVCLAAVR